LHRVLHYIVTDVSLSIGINLISMVFRFIHNVDITVVDIS